MSDKSIQKDAKSSLIFPKQRSVIKLTRALWARILIVILSVVTPVILIGAVVGWNRTTKELSSSTKEQILVAIILSSSMILAFFAGWYLVRGGNSRQSWLSGVIERYLKR